MALLLSYLIGSSYWNTPSGPPPSVRIDNGTVIGTVKGNIENFRGIPFAQDPVGNLRLRPPQTITDPFVNGTFHSVEVPVGCPPLQSRVKSGEGSLGYIVSLVQGTPKDDTSTNFGEACLNLNVQRPVGTNATDKLPVVLWFFGGGFESGSTQAYDGTNIITKSVAMGHPVVYVATNYRNGAFGFLHGKQLVAEGNTNLGLRDQRKAMQWVAENIAAFGGDPDKITLWGESAGSISVMDHMILDGGDINYKGKPLFRAGIMNSGSITPVVPADSPKAQAVYDQVVQEAGCSAAKDTLSCLRGVPYEAFAYAANSLPGIFSYRSVDLAYIPRPDNTTNFLPVSPEKLIENGTYARVPVIIGDQEDEGTLFAQVQTNITTDKELNDYFVSFFANASYDIVAGMTSTYPQTAEAGSPFGTGDWYNSYPQYKRLAAIIGDSVFTLKRRIFIDYTSKVMPTWSYMATYLSTPYLGTWHGSDILETYIGTPNEKGDSMLAYYISFINTLDPNTLTKGNYTQWPKWDSDSRTVLNMTATGNILGKDNFRESSFQYLKAHLSNFQT